MIADSSHGYGIQTRAARRIVIALDTGHWTLDPGTLFVHTVSSSCHYSVLHWLHLYSVHTYSLELKINHILTADYGTVVPGTHTTGTRGPLIHRSTGTLPGTVYCPEQEFGRP